MSALPAWAGPYLVAAILLLGAAVGKLADPRSTVGALRAVGVRVGPAAVRAGAAGEVAVAVAALAGLRAGAVLLATTYAALAAFVAVALRGHTPVASCGCFGKADTPPSAVHLAMNAGAFGAGLLAARAGGLAPVGALTRATAPEALAFVVLLAAGTYAAYLVLAVLPQARAR